MILEGNAVQKLKLSGCPRAVSTMKVRLQESWEGAGMRPTNDDHTMACIVEMPCACSGED